MIHIDYERAFVCRQCGQGVIVGGFVDHIDPERFRCVACRLADVIADARRKQEAA